jgi:pimeloyl-ACP methyl ester carboxylesterase
MKKALKIISISIGSILMLLLLILAVIYLYNTTFIERGEPANRAPSSSKFIDIGGETISYGSINNHSSKTAVFVGGLGAWYGTWQRTLASTSASLPLNYIALDLPPFGYGTPDMDKGFFRDAQAERILRSIKSLGLVDVILVAHSYGAGPAAEAVIRDKGARIKKFVVIDGVLNIDEQKEPYQGIMNNDFIRTWGIGILAHTKAFVANRLKSFAYKTDNISDTMMAVYTQPFDTSTTTSRLSAWVKAYSNDPLGYDSTKSDSYRKIHIPVRIIWGDKDSLTPLVLAEKLTMNVPDAELTILPGIGHMPMIEDFVLFDMALSKALRE